MLLRRGSFLKINDNKVVFSLRPHCLSMGLWHTETQRTQCCFEFFFERDTLLVIIFWAHLS
jgi:hypothetical protein